ncbi:MAG: hypothetical protein KBS75_09355 [Bacteroidales bacterium]|nr:hypothetical protein [Candidatus Equimonas faecalis]
MMLTFNIPSVEELKAKVGIGAIDDTTQRWWTQNVLRRMLKYIPMETGAFTKNTVISSVTTITSTADQANYLYYGKRMVNAKTGKGPRYIPGVGYRWPRGATLIPTTQDLNYTKTFHPLAGPYWDERLKAAEGEILAEELEKYLMTRLGGE